MGGRKFQLGRAIKNTEIKERKPSNLVVSIPRNLLHIQRVCPELNLSLCSEAESSVDEPHLTVSLPLHVSASSALFVVKIWYLT